MFKWAHSPKAESSWSIYANYKFAELVKKLKKLHQFIGVREFPDDEDKYLFPRLIASNEDVESALTRIQEAESYLNEAFEVVRQSYLILQNAANSGVVGAKLEDVKVTRSPKPPFNETLLIQDGMPLYWKGMQIVTGLMVLLGRTEDCTDKGKTQHKEANAMRLRSIGLFPSMRSAALMVFSPPHVLSPGDPGNPSITSPLTPRIHPATSGMGQESHGATFHGSKKHMVLTIMGTPSKRERGNSLKQRKQVKKENPLVFASSLRLKEVGGGGGEGYQDDDDVRSESPRGESRVSELDEPLLRGESLRAIERTELELFYGGARGADRKQLHLGSSSLLQREGNVPTVEGEEGEDQVLNVRDGGIGGTVDCNTVNGKGINAIAKKIKSGFIRGLRWMFRRNSDPNDVNLEKINPDCATFHDLPTLHEIVSTEPDRKMLEEDDVDMHLTTRRENRAKGITDTLSADALSAKNGNLEGPRVDRGDPRKPDPVDQRLEYEYEQGAPRLTTMCAFMFVVLF